MRAVKNHDAVSNATRLKLAPLEGPPATAVAETSLKAEIAHDLATVRLSMLDLIETTKHKPLILLGVEIATGCKTYYY